MKLYHIKVNGRYFAGEDPEKTVKMNIGPGGWYPQNKHEVSALNFTKDKNKARQIDRLTLKGHLQMLIERDSQNVIDIKKLEVIGLKEEKANGPK